MQSLAWYVQRLRRMSSAEVAHRLGRAARSARSRLEMSQSPAAPPPDLALAERRFLPALTPASAEQPGFAAIVAQAERLVAGRIPVFDLQHCHLGDPPEWNRDPLTQRLAPWRAASAIDYRDEREVGNIKYLWEPNRHLHFVTLAQAHALTGDEQYLRTLVRHLDSWLAQCPVGRGPNWISPLEMAIRLINWSAAWQLVGGARSAMFQSAEGIQLRERWLSSIFHHVRTISGNLSRFSSANNHLIGETAGVVVAATTWPCWPQVRDWGERCQGILEHECLAQNAADGGNREQAIAYQQFVLDFLIVAGLAVRAGGQDFAPDYWLRIESMIAFLASMTDAGGHVPMLGDADDGYVVRLSQEPDFCPYRSLVATGALLFDRADFAVQARRDGPARLDTKSITLLGPDAQRRYTALCVNARSDFAPRRSHPDSGYYLLGEYFGTPREVRLLCDVGPLGYLSIAAHGHADALAVVLSIAGNEILVDPGTYSYHTEPRWRRYFRGTAAHNTVVVDGVDQSEQRGNFMWSDHARARCLEFSERAGRQSLLAEHDGYRRLRDPVIHRRAVSFEPGCIEIADTLQATGEHRACRRWHFAENVRVTLLERGAIRAEAERVSVLLTPFEEPDRARLHRGGNPEEGGWVSRRFGVKVPSSTVSWESDVEGGAGALLRTRITWALREAAPARLRVVR